MTWNELSVINIFTKGFFFFLLSTFFYFIEKNAEYLICYEKDVILLHHFLNLLVQK
jgi:hypothetical protein